MAIVVSSSPVSIPTGLRATAGLIDFNGTTYSAGGLAVTAAQFGGGSNGIPNRLPDFVFFTAASAADDADTDAAIVLRYLGPATAKVAAYGSEPLVDEAGLGEDDAAANLATAKFLAVWVAADPSGVTVV